MSIKNLPVGIDNSKPQKAEGYVQISIIGWEDGDVFLGYTEKNGELYATVERNSSVEEDDDDSDGIDIDEVIDELFF